MTPLTPVQKQVIAAIVEGSNQSAAAEAAGIHRNTIAHWRKTSADFREALADAQYEKAILYREQAEPFMQLAMESFRSLLADPKTPATVRFKTAQFIFEKASTPPPPQPAKPAEPAMTTSDLAKLLFPPYPESRAEAIMQAAQNPEKMHNSAQPKPTAPAANSSSPQPQKPPAVHNSAQWIRPEPIEPRTVAPKIGRNEACPCGSGKKYKRCCLGSQENLAAAA
jgi:hypothetical protein